MCTVQIKKWLCLLLLTLATALPAMAKHIKGGYIRYEYAGAASATSSNYKVTVTLFFACGAMGPRQSVDLYIYDAIKGNLITSIGNIQYNSTNSVTKTSNNPCMSNPPTICYDIYTYTTMVTLANNANGYDLAVTENGKRIAGIVNIYNSSNMGILITAQIPGTIGGVDYHVNTSPEFIFKDTAIICYNGRFNYQFSAIDSIDHDSLSYAFGDGLDNANGTTKPYASLSYSAGFSGASPLGSGVTIDPATGLISGIAPATTGDYVVAVYVKEWRNGVVISEVKKELQIAVYNCSLLGADLEKEYINCDSLTLSFQNLSSSPNITGYTWTFGDPASGTNISSNPVGTHTFSQAGTYTITLDVSNNGGCTDKAVAIAKVYPGFTPRFTVKGGCIYSPLSYTDSTIAAYGTVNSWSWNFGEPSSASNTSSINAPQHLYAAPKTYTVLLKVSSTVGCVDTVSQQVVVNDKPYIYLPFTDTLICSIDSLPLIANTNSTDFDWKPTIRMLQPTTLTPIVFPKDTTNYTITVRENGCVGSATIKVNVLQYITVRFNPDTMHVCKTDSITLSPISYALSYRWSEPLGGKTLDQYNVKYPRASPSNTITKYHLQANLGHCPASADVTVYASPYPKVSITYPKLDTTICYGGLAKLVAVKTAHLFSWSPESSLANSKTLTPTAKPDTTTTYRITVKDTFYCPKPVSASTVVKVVPPIYINAGNDTVAVIKQPLQLNASLKNTGFNFPIVYQWKPTTNYRYLNRTDTAAPIFTATAPSPATVTYAVKASTAQGCTGYDTMTVKIYTTLPDIFIPSAFSPNNDGLNDVLTPITVGIAQFDFFKVFNRYGQQVFSTSQQGVGWNGLFNGFMADPGTYVFMAQGVDYLGNVIFKKGTVVVLR